MASSIASALRPIGHCTRSNRLRELLLLHADAVEAEAADGGGVRAGGRAGLPGNVAFQRGKRGLVRRDSTSVPVFICGVKVRITPFRAQTSSFSGG